jgi:hypothetical protein
MYNNQGIEGAKTWVKNNLLGEAEKEDLKAGQISGKAGEAISRMISDDANVGYFTDLSQTLLKYIGKNDPKYTALKAYVENANAPLINARYGAALSGIENQRAMSYLIDFTKDT